MMSIKVNFSKEKILKKLEEEINKNPKKLLSSNAGYKIDVACPKCSSKGLTISKSGLAICDNPSCNAEININLDCNF